MRRIAALGFLLLLAAVPLAAQIGESMTVEVIEVPVYVSKGRKPVRGLTRDDFRLTVNGKPQTIDYFDVLDRRDPSTAADAPELNRRRMTMLLFDVMHSMPWTIRRAQKAAMEFVARSRPTDSYSVAVISTRGIAMLVPFTTDHVNVQRAIASLSASRAGDAFGIATTVEERSRWEPTSAAEGREPGAGARPIDRELTAELEVVKEYFAQQQRQVRHRDLIRQLGDLADALAPLEGQKSVVLLSQGATSEADSDVFLYSDLLRMHRSFRTAGVILNAIDLTGLAGPFDPQPTSELYTLALDTGGYVQSNRNDFLAALRDLDEMESVVYILGFRPPADQKRTNSIRVKVRGAGLTTDVRYRKAYSASEPGAAAMNSVVLADVLLNDIPLRGISLGADIRPSGDAAAITVSVPGKEVLAYIGDADATADVFIYIFDRENNVAGWGQKQIGIKGMNARQYLETNPLRVAEMLRLAPGRYVAKVLFRVRGTEAAGFTRTEFEVGG